MEMFWVILDETILEGLQKCFKE